LVTIYVSVFDNVVTFSRSTAIFDSAQFYTSLIPCQILLDRVCHANQLAILCYISIQEIPEDLPNCQREFTDHKNNEYSCPICLGVMTDAQVIPCGHEFCNSCLISLCLQSSTQIACPVCRTLFDITTKQHAYCSQRKINLLRINCRYSGCMTENSRLSIILHENAPCLFFPFPCHHCGMQIAIGEMCDHWKTCAQFPRPCSFNCGGFYTSHEHIAHEILCALAASRNNFQDLKREISLLTETVISTSNRLKRRRSF